MTALRYEDQQGLIDLQAVTCRPDSGDPEFCEVHEDGMFAVGEAECDEAIA